MAEIKLTPEMVEAIENIVSRGNTCEVKKRKDDVICLESKKKIEQKMPL